jgi:hypothetical protein
MVDWRKLHNEEVRNFCSLPKVIIMIQSRRMKWTALVARRGEKRNACGVFVGNPEGKRPLEKPRRVWVTII